MTSILIARLPPHSKSPKAIEFMQENGFFYRISSNAPLANLLMSSGKVEDSLAQMMGLCEEFKPEKEEMKIVKELMKTLINESHQVLGDSIVHSGKKEKRPVELEKSISEAVEMEEEVNSDGMEGDFETTNEDTSQEKLLIQQFAASEVKEEVVSDDEQGKPSQVDVEQAEEGRVDDHHEEREKDLNDRVAGTDRNLSVDVLDATDPDAAPSVRLPSHDFDEPTHPFDFFDEDLQVGDEEKVMEHSIGNVMDMEDNEKMEEFEDDEEDMEKQMDESSDEDLEGEKNEDDKDEDSDDGQEMATVDEEKAKDEKSTCQSSDHVGRRLFTCPVKNCPSSYSKFEELEEHVKTHSGKQKFFCDVCKKRFSVEAEAMAHVKKREKKECCRCRKRFASRSHLVQNFVSHTGEKPFVCATCDERFSRLAHLQRHMFKHTGEKPFSCGHCEEGFFEKRQLVMHEFTHTGKKPFECNSCGRTFNNRSSSKGHFCEDTSEKPYSARSATRSLRKAGISRIT